MEHVKFYWLAQFLSESEETERLLVLPIPKQGDSVGTLYQLAITPLASLAAKAVPIEGQGMDRQALPLSGGFGGQAHAARTVGHYYSLWRKEADIPADWFEIQTVA